MRSKMKVPSKGVVKAQLETAEDVISRALDALREGDPEQAAETLGSYTKLAVTVSEVPESDVSVTVADEASDVDSSAVN